MKLPFGLKIGIGITALAVGVTGCSLVFFYQSTRAMLIEQMGRRLEDIGTSSRYLFEEEEIAAIERLKLALEQNGENRSLILPLMQPGSYAPALQERTARKLMESADFQVLVGILRKIKDATRRRGDQVEDGGEPGAVRPSLAYATLISLIPESGDRSVLQFIADADYDKAGLENPIGNLFFNNSEAIRNAFGGETGSDTQFRKEQEEFLFSAGIPLFNSQRKVVAVLALDYDAKGEAHYVGLLWNICMLTIVGSLALSVLMAIGLARLLNRPLRVLREGAERVRQRDFSTHINLQSTDEFGLLAGTFNSMVSEVREYAQGLEDLNAAYYRFVPRQFLDQLGQSRITDVKLGDQVQRQMTVLFSDIRSFTSISESMSPRDNFDFINSYLKVVGPVIRDHGGFIDKYIGDAVMALFPDSVDQALKAAIAMQQSLVGFNVQQTENGRPTIRIGVALHNGHLMLGTVGEEQRMDGTVISDAVNLASRLEGLTKEYGAPLIVSESVLTATAGRFPFHARYLGRVQVKGKRLAVGLFEIIEGEIEDDARRKIITTADFEAGVRAFEAGQRVDAVQRLTRVLDIHPGDVAAKLYLERCRRSGGKRSRRARVRRLFEVSRRSGTTRNPEK